MTDPEAAAIERAHVVLLRSRADEVLLRRRTAWHLSWYIGVDWRLLLKLRLGSRRRVAYIPAGRRGRTKLLLLGRRLPLVGWLAGLLHMLLLVRVLRWRRRASWWRSCILLRGAAGRWV